jgi:glucan phosphoethanolaminetransferase (alkaline phosphatase superfamily)
MLCKYNQLVLRPRAGNAITIGLIAYSVLVVYLNWGSVPNDISNGSIITILLSAFAIYVIHCFLNGKDMQVLLASLDYNDEDFCIALRWFWFIVSCALVLLLPVLASSLDK